MTLQEWLEREGTGAKTRLQRATGLRWQTVHELAEGRVKQPRPETARKIEDATEGKVSAAELLGFNGEDAA